MAGIPFPRARASAPVRGGYRPPSRGQPTRGARTPLEAFKERFPPEVVRHAEELLYAAAALSMAKSPALALIELGWHIARERVSDRLAPKGALSVPPHVGFKQECDWDHPGENRKDLYTDGGASCGAVAYLTSMPPPVTAGTNAYISMQKPDVLPGFFTVNGWWSRQPGFSGAPRMIATVWPWPEVPVWANPWEVVAPHIDPMSVPIQQPFEAVPIPYPMIPYRTPNPWRSPVEQPQRGPAPARSPVPRPNPIRLPAPYPQPTASPDSAPTLVLDPLNRRDVYEAPPALALRHRPYPGWKEGKSLDRAARQALSMAAVATEARDVVKAMYDALPRGCKSWRRFRRDPGSGVVQSIGKRTTKDRAPTPSMSRMMGDIASCIGHVDQPKAGVTNVASGRVGSGKTYWQRVGDNLTYNELQDRTFGTIGKAIGRESLRRGRPVGYQAGPAM